LSSRINLHTIERVLTDRIDFGIFKGYSLFLVGFVFGEILGFPRLVHFLIQIFFVSLRGRPHFEAPVAGLRVGQQPLSGRFALAIYIMKSVYRRAILAFRNLANFKESVKDAATVDGLCGYVISASEGV
ncbi:MAG: hypothetical protein NC301_09525, partial [Bacteroides sp.]|nr:hypothetical protein [Bacteroides sp.]